MVICCSVCVCMCAQLCWTLCDPMDCNPPGSSGPWDSPGKNTGVGCHALLQGIFPTQGSNPSLLNRQANSLPLSHLRSPICCSSNRKKTHGSRQDWVGGTDTGYSPSPFRGCRLELDAGREPDVYRDAVWHVYDARTWEESRWRGKASRPEHAVQPLQSHWPA